MDKNFVDFLNNLFQFSLVYVLTLASVELIIHSGFWLWCRKNECKDECKDG